ncbi:hypothetical protein HFD88_002031 [Aspergillus terreus]|nr:hypothetical protein HFD88_002031 [Aspergillus terreus]
MPRTPTPPSRTGSYSSYSSSSSVKDYDLSVNIYGRGDKSLGHPPSHWGIQTSKTGSQYGQLYHVRKKEDFYYHPEERPVVSKSSTGRSNVASMSKTNRDRAGRILDAYGNEKSNLPFGEQNCQDWTVGALGKLEEKRFVQPGTRDYWEGNIGESSRGIERRLQQDGKSWIPNEDHGPPRAAPADETFGRKEERKPIGKLDTSKFAGLMGGVKNKSRRL